MRGERTMRRATSSLCTRPSKAPCFWRCWSGCASDHGAGRSGWRPTARVRPSSHSKTGCLRQALPSRAASGWRSSAATTASEVWRSCVLEMSRPASSRCCDASSLGCFTELGRLGELSPQLTAFFTSALILSSSAAVNSFSAKAVGHMAPSSRFAVSLKPSVAYLVLNFCALWKKQTILPSWYTRASRTRFSARGLARWR